MEKMNFGKLGSGFVSTDFFNELNDIVVEGIIFSCLEGAPGQRRNYIRPVTEYKPAPVKPAELTNRPSEVQIIRHFRRWDMVNGGISNFGGITALVFIDYPTGTMRAYMAFCSDADNFDREYGLSIAADRLDNNIGIRCDYSCDLSIAENISRALHTDQYACTSYSIDENKRLKSLLNNSLIATKISSAIF